MNHEHRARLVSYADAYANPVMRLAQEDDISVLACLSELVRGWIIKHEEAGKPENAAACRETLKGLSPDENGQYGWRALERIFLARWGAAGRPTLIPADIHWAGAMCATNISAEILSMVRAPWPALVVEIPPELGLVKMFDGLDISLAEEAGVMAPKSPTEYPITTLALLVHRPRAGEAVLAGHSAEGLWVSTLAYGACPAGGLWDLPYYRTCRIEELGDDLEKLNESQDDHYLRVQKLVGKLVLGCLLAMQGGSSRATSAKSKERRSRAGKLPSAVEFVVGTPVHVRTVDYVRNFLAKGPRGANAGKVFVQRLIAGHWKNQPHGPGGTLRKFIHVEPYWRGPEDAPIAVSPHIIKPKKGDGEGGAPPQAAE